MKKLKTLAVLSLLVFPSSALFAADSAKTPVTKDEAVQSLEMANRANKKALWESVVNGTHPKIGFTSPEAYQACQAMMQGSEFREALCKLAEPLTPEEQQERAAAARAALAAKRAAAGGGISVEGPGATPQAITPQDVYVPPDICTTILKLQVKFQELADEAAAHAGLAGGGCMFGCEPCCFYAAATTLQIVYWEYYAHDMQALAITAKCN